jgi:hypothetical protein
MIACKEAGLQRVLDHREIPLHTSGSENDMGAWLIRQKISAD